MLLPTICDLCRLRQEVLAGELPDAIFAAGKTHSLIAAVHVAKHGERVADMASSFGIRRFPDPANTRVAAFVGENSDPLVGSRQTIDGQNVTTFTPWGQIALMAGGLAGYDIIKEYDLQGVAPSSDALEKALGERRPASPDRPDTGR